MTVDKASGGSGPTVGDSFIGIDIPGFMFAIKPNNGSQIIMMVNSGACKTGGFNLNWVAVNQNDPALSGYIYGTVAWDIGSGTVQVDSAFQTDKTAMGGPLSISSIDASDCIEGIAEAASGDERMYINNAGGMIINTDTSDNGTAHFVLGLEADEVELSQLAGDWYGFVVDKSDSTPIRTVTASIASGGAVTLTAIDPETGSASGSLTDSTLDFIELNFNDGAKNHYGMFRYDFSSGGDPDGGCAIDTTIQEDGNARIIFCSGRRSGGAEAYNLVLVYKP